MNIARKWIHVKSNCMPLIGKRCFASNIKPIAMAYDEYGKENQNKSPLIIMHGLMGAKQNWRGIGGVLGEKLQRKIYTVDARNHGESPHTDIHNAETMAEDVKKFIEARNLKRAIVVGHSMGGRTMMFFTMKYSDMVENTIIVDISPVSLPSSLGVSNDILMLMHDINFPNGISLTEARKLATKVLSGHLTKDTINFFLLNLKSTDDGRIYWMANLKLLSQQLGQMRTFGEQLADFPPYKGPVHFIVGTKSDFFREKDWPAVKKFFPAADILQLNSGHLVHFEQPQQFVDAVVDFVNH